MALPLAHVDDATAATLSGKVTFTGNAPPMPAIDMSANPMCELQHHTPVKSEQVTVNANGTLRNVLVWVKDGLPRARWQAPETPVTLDQNGCVYQPHVLAFMVNQQVEIMNDDPVNHNVHAESVVNAAWNESQPPRAEKKFKRFTEPEVWFPVSCSVHPWMRSYIAVLPHPFFAVTGDDGAFLIKGLAPGTYTLETVHEKYGRKDSKFTVGPKESKVLDFSYAG